MKIIEDQVPRRDGLIEARGTWGEVTVGTLIASGKRTEVWEVVDTQAGAGQIEPHKTLWFKMRERATGREFAKQPTMINIPVTLLLEPGQESLPPITPASDGDALALLVEELGASLIATKDNTSGEIWCPDYDAGAGSKAGDGGAAYLMHLQVCHDIDTSALEALPWQERIVEKTRIHGRAHSAKFPHIGKGGFAHRHVPEDHSLI